MSKTADDFLERRPELLDGDFTWPAFVRLVSAVAALPALYFRFRGEGLEKVPAGGCLVVANHSDAALWEILLLLRWWRQVHGERPVRGLAHRIGFEPPLSVLRGGLWLGSILAHPKVARRRLERGDTLLVFPGGDLDACRSFFERDQVIFGGRAGFARLAREANVPVVPLAITGAHASYFMLPGMRRLARLLRLEKRGLKAAPVTGGLALFLGAGVATLVQPALWPVALGALVQLAWPLPSRIEVDVLDPVRPADGESDEAFAERVRAAIEEAVKKRTARRWTPWG